MAKNNVEQRDLNEEEELCLINSIITVGNHWRDFLNCYKEPKNGNQSHPGGSVFGLMQGGWKNAVRELLNIWIYGHHKVKFQRDCINGIDPHELRKLNWGAHKKYFRSTMIKDHDPPVDMIVKEFEKMMASASWTVPENQELSQ
ncbi:hypothetical protein AGMMS49944_10120 [Spirochaetia bacterium]|nr:hypothetical protein AGMMS49944_10120 [Spirochaetia bacterium]